MFFLIRMAFWLGIVLILLPSGTTQQGPATDNVAATEAISAASATVSDLRGFCSRQPDACTVGSHVAVSLGYKAQAGAKMLYEFLSEAMASHDTGSTGLRGGTIKSVLEKALPDKSGADKSAPEKASASAGSQNTLTPSDLAPAWRGPQSPAQARGKHA
jgi:hypothetical protein